MYVYICVCVGNLVAFALWIYEDDFCSNKMGNRLWFSSGIKVFK